MFNTAGVPSAWFYRPACSAGQPFYRSREDTLDKISLPVMAALVDAQAAVLERLAEGRALPFRRTIPAAQRTAIRAHARNLYL